MYMYGSVAVAAFIVMYTYLPERCDHHLSRKMSTAGYRPAPSVAPVAGSVFHAKIQKDEVILNFFRDYDIGPMNKIV